MKYIGEDCVYADPVAAQSIHLENGKDYNVQIQHEGPMMVINGQQIESPDSTYWVCFDNGVRMPYAPQCLPRQWEL